MPNSPTGAEDSGTCPRSAGIVAAIYLLKVCGYPFAAATCVVKDGDIVLCDMGCELYCYASDITNSFPAKSLPQKLPSSRSNTWKSLEMRGGFVVGDTVTKFRLEYEIRRWKELPLKTFVESGGSTLQQWIGAHVQKFGVNEFFNLHPPFFAPAMFQGCQKPCLNRDGMHQFR